MSLHIGWMQIELSLFLIFFYAAFLWDSTLSGCCIELYASAPCPQKVNQMLPYVTYLTIWEDILPPNAEASQPDVLLL